MNWRFIDEKMGYWAFVDPIYVSCPQCQSRAKIFALDKPNRLHCKRRVVCSACGFNLEKRNAWRKEGPGSPVDPFFRLPLWLTGQFGVQTLWAFNYEHLEYIESFVKAKHRSRNIHAAGCLNCSVISRLPRWLKKANKRQSILNIIQKIKEKQ